MGVLLSMTVHGFVPLWWIVLSSITQGVLSATPLIFIIPSACFLKLSPGRWFQGENLIPSILIFTGMFVMITGLTMTGLYPQDCSHGREMFYCADSNVSGTVPPAWLKPPLSFSILSIDIVQKTIISECIRCKHLSVHFILFYFYFTEFATPVEVHSFIEALCFHQLESRTVLLLECFYIIAALQYL